MGVEPVIDISKVNEERDREEKGVVKQVGGRGEGEGDGGRGTGDGVIGSSEEERSEARRGKRERGRARRERRRGRITETEREIDVEGLSTTDKYYIRASRRRARTRAGSVGVLGTRYVHHATPAVSLIF